MLKIILKKILNRCCNTNLTLGSSSPIITGNKNSCTINNNTIEDFTTKHIELEKKVKSEIDAFFNSFEICLEQFQTADVTADFYQLRKTFIDLLDSIDSYKVSLISNNITKEIVSFYDIELIKIFEIAQIFNDFIDCYSLNISKISREYFTALLPKDESLSNKYDEIIEIYNNI